MTGIKLTQGAATRAERLRLMAEQAKNLAALAGLADAQLVQAARDVLTLAQAAKQFAARLEAMAAGDEVEVGK